MQVLVVSPGNIHARHLPPRDRQHGIDDGNGKDNETAADQVGQPLIPQHEYHHHRAVAQQQTAAVAEED